MKAHLMKVQTKVIADYFDDLDIFAKRNETPEMMPLIAVLGFWAFAIGWAIFGGMPEKK